MKVIERPKPVPPAPQWPTGHTLACVNCKTVVEIESEDDFVRHWAERSPNGNVGIAWTCPECGNYQLAYRNGPSTFRIRGR